MSSPRYARWAARLLAPQQPARPNPGAARDRGVATIERALRARQLRARFATIAGLAAVAAGVLVWIGLTRFESPGVAPAERVSVLVSPTREGALLRDSRGELPLEAITALPSGGQIRTAPGGGAALQLSTGTRLELGSASALTLVSQDALQLFALHQGALDAHIAKLGASQRFVVDTPDAQIEVRGTVFRLEVLEEPQPCGAGARSRLEVREGVVELRSGSRVIRVGAGEHWPADCESGASGRGAPASAAANSASLGAAEAEPRVSKTGPAASKARSAKGSLLAAQNDAFRDALRAQDRSDTAAALRAYAQFIRRYPTSPLAENACVERLRLLATSDPARARAEAARYLERYPGGFAREEAERIREAP